MNKEQLEYHVGMKKANPSYPALPNCLKLDQTKEDKAKYKRLMTESQNNLEGCGDYSQSVVRGFLSRVRNWELDRKKAELTLPILAS